MATALVASSAQTVTRVVGHGVGDLAAVAERLGALRVLGHPGVLVPEAISFAANGEVLATAARIAGDDAGTVARLRGGLTEGECVAVGIDVAKALAALHGAGLAHGDVSPANVVLTRRGAVLVDALAGALPGERGTAGFAAPERVVAATPLADLYSLGRLLRSLAREEASERIIAWTEALCALEPTARPSAEVAARALRSCAEPSPVGPTVVDLASAIRARVVPLEASTLKLAEGRTWRIRRGLLRGARWAAWGVGGLAAVVALVTTVAALIPHPPEYYYFPTYPISDSQIAAPPPEAAGALVEARFSALAAADGAALLAVTTAEGLARGDDLPTATRLDEGDLRYEGLGVTVTDAEELSASGNDATVRVTYGVSAHVMWDGAERVEVAARTVTTDYDITWTGEGWRVVRARTKG